MANEGEFTAWADVLTMLVAQQSLERRVAERVMDTILAGTATDAQIAGFLIGLSAKGETTDEVLGMRDAMLSACAKLDLPAGTTDIVGVGGAPRRRVSAFNVSTIASFVAAAAGATICKHGNRKASSTSGSFDLLEALGVNIDIAPAKVEAGVRSIGLGFAFARAHHRAMRHVGPARSQLNVPTVFNVLGPLAHPGQLRRQVVGVPDAGRAEQIANVIAGTDAECVWVVHGHLDIDELSTTGPADVIEVIGTSQRRFVVDPTHHGLATTQPESILGGDATQNARLAQAIFAGEKSPNRDMVVLNAAAGLVVAGEVKSISSAIDAAAAAIDDGRAAAKLEALVAHTNA